MTQRPIKYRALISSDWNECLVPSGPFDFISFTYPSLDLGVKEILKEYTGNRTPLSEATRRIASLLPQAIMRASNIPPEKVILIGDSGGDGPHFEWGAKVGAFLVGSMTKSSLDQYCNQRGIKINLYFGLRDGCRCSRILNTWRQDP